ncbi:MAG: 5-guanidino-2-oxopentanoate decarboxylase [Pseudomonadota bacterium]
MSRTSSNTLGEYLIRCLEACDTDYVFGIPGVHTVSLYRGLAVSSIRHITPRHEQGAGFMADGYARISGKPGVCFVITGPGLSNIATAMLQARADSIPMLVISTINDPDRHARGSLHEMPDQTAFAKTVATSSSLVTNGAELRAALDAAYSLFSSGRRGPVHIELPLSAINAPCDDALPDMHNAPKPTPSAARLQKAIDLIGSWEKPLILAGGGAGKAGSQILDLAEHLGAPVVTTVNARSAFPNDHPMAVHASASLMAVRSLIAQADGLIAMGTELGPTDYDMYETLGPVSGAQMVRVDVDPNQAQLNAEPDVILIGDAGEIAALLRTELAPQHHSWADQIAAARQSVTAELSSDYQSHIALLNSIRDAVPDTVFVGDSTQLVYAGNLAFAPGDTGNWFNSATGYGTLGYGLSAAMGAKLADEERPVLCIIGDGGLQFALGDLGTLAALGVPVVVLVWNDSAYGEIAQSMRAAGIAEEVIAVSCEVTAPDFATIARAYGLDAMRHVGKAGLAESVAQALASKTSVVIDAQIAQ